MTKRMSGTCVKYRVIVDILLGPCQKPKSGWKNEFFDVKGTETRESNVEMSFTFVSLIVRIVLEEGRK